MGSVEEVQVFWVEFGLILVVEGMEADAACLGEVWGRICWSLGG